MSERADPDAGRYPGTLQGAGGRGRRGFGRSQDRRHVVTAEAELIRDAALRVLNGETLVSIVDDWNRQGVRTTTGGPWHINALSALLTQPRLTPSILDQATHDRLVALRRTRRKVVPQSSAGNRRYLLTGLLRCWRCGSRLTATARFGATAQPCYRCPSRGAGGCSGAIIRTDLAERAARDAVVERVDDPQFAAWLRCQEARLADQEQALTAIITAALRGPMGVDGGGLWVDGRINGRGWRELKDRLEDWVSAQGAGLVYRSVLDRQQRLYGSGTTLAASWDGMTMEARRAVIEAIVEHFVVWPAARPRNSFHSDRLKPIWRTS